MRLRAAVTLLCVGLVTTACASTNAFVTLDRARALAAAQQADADLAAGKVGGPLGRTPAPRP